MTRFVTSLVLALLVAAVIAGQGVVGQSGTPAEQALSIRRTTLSEDRLSAALAKVEQGALIRLTPAEFDRLLASPNRLRPRPTLVAARYRAKLVSDDAGESSLRGTAEWAIRHVGPGPGVLRLDDLGIALRQAKWSDGEDAVLYKSAVETQPCLYLPVPGDRTLNLDWSVRGVPEPGEVRFDVRLPSTAIGSLELELPADVTPIFPQAEILATGPFAVGVGEHLWRIACGRSTRIEIVLGRPAAAAPPLFVSTNAIQTLNTTGGLARFEFQTETARNGFSELTIRHDRAFQPTTVVVNNLLSWTASDSDSTIVVRLREPTRNASIVLSGTFAVTLGQKPWFSPDAWIVGAINRSERLRVAIPSAITWRDWHPGSFSLLRGQPTVDRSFTIEAESGPAVAGQTRPTRPSLILFPRAAAAWTATQTASWTIGPASESWQVRTIAAVNSGSLSAMQFAIPPDWEVERVDGTMPDITWSVVEPSRRLRVDLNRVARRGERVEATVRLRGKRQLRPSASLQFPDLVPEGADGRTGTLAIRIDPMWEAILSDPLPGITGPAVDREPDEVVRAIGPEALIGTLALNPRRPRARAEFASDVLSSDSTPTIRTTLTLVPAAGAVSELRLWTDGPVAEPWVWRDSEGRRLADAVHEPVGERLAWLLAIAPMPAIAHIAELAGLPESAGRQWRLQFPRPLSQPTTLVSEYTSPAKRWPFPGAMGIPFQAVVRVPPFANALSIPNWLSPRGTEADGNRVFRYGSENKAIFDRSGIGPAQFDAPRLITKLMPDGRRHEDFRVRIRGDHSEKLVLTLPDRAESVAVSVAGRSVVAPRLGSALPTIEIPVPMSANWLPIDVRYALPAVGGVSFNRLTSLAPVGPFDPATVRHVWHLSPEWGPIDANRFRALPGDRETQPKMPLPDWRAFTGGRVDRLAIPENRFGADDSDSIRDAIERAFPGQPVLIDMRAFSSTTLTPSSQMSMFQGDQSPDHLVTTQWANSVLVTRADAIRQWQALASWYGRWPTDVTDALATAAKYGTDASGRFRTLNNWSADSMRDDAVYRAPPGWAIVEGEFSDEATLVVRSDWTRVAGWIVGFGLALALLVSRWQRISALIFVSVVLAGCITSLLMPGQVGDVAVPIAFSVGGGYLLFLLRTRRPLVPAESPRAATPARIAIVGLLLVGITTWASAADRPTVDVFQIVDRDGVPSAILVAPEVLDRIRRERGWEPSIPEVVITAAKYVGAREGGTIRFRGKFQVFAFRAEPTKVVLPLGNARIRSLAIDGSEAGELDAAPDALRATVRGTGPHTVDVDFSIPISVSGSDREVRFPVPEVPISHLAIESPTPGVRVRTSNWRGTVRRTDSAMDVDLGLAPLVALRWSGEAGDGKATTQVKEASIWQVGLVSSTLTGLVEYRVNSGVVSALRIAVPRSAEIYRLAVVGEPAAPGSPPIRVREWQLSPLATGTHRTLNIELLTPATGRVTVQLEMVAAASPTESATLYFPRAIDVVESESHAAVVALGSSESSRIEAEGLIEAPTEAFTQSVWMGLHGAAFAGKVTRAYRATGTGVPRLIVSRRPTLGATSAIESATWWIAPTQMIGLGEMKWVTGGAPLLEWMVPADVKLLAVTGQRVQYWSQSGNKVQLWLNRPAAEVDVNWRAIRTSDNLAGRVNIPVNHHVAAAHSVVSRAVAVDCQAFMPLANQDNLTLVGPQRLGEIAWRSTEAKDVSLAMATPTSTALLSAHTSLRTNEDRIEAETTIDLGSLPADRPTLLNLYVSAGNDAEVRVDVPAPLTATAGATELAGRRWDIGVPAGHAGPRFVAVTASHPSSEPRAMTRCRVFVGSKIEVALSQSLSIDSKAVWLRDAIGLSRTGSEWRSTLPDWSATIVKETGLAGSDRANARRANISVARAGGLWLYRGHFNAPADVLGVLRILPPPGATLLELSVDGSPIVVSASEPAARAVAAGSHAIMVLWSSPNASFVPARFLVDGVPLSVGTIEWIVRVPADRHIVGASMTPVEEAANRTEDRQALSRGLAYRFESSDDDPAAVGIGPRSGAHPWQKIGLVASIGLLVGFLALAWPRGSAPEQAAGLGFVGVLAFGPAAAGLLLIPAFAFLWRLRLIARRLVNPSPWRRHLDSVG